MENSTSTSATSISYNLVFALVIPSICFLTVLGNLGTLYAFWRVPSLLEKPSEYLILHLSIADLITGLLCVSGVSPMYITPGQWPFREIGCRLLGVVSDISVHTSLFLLLAISIDRFLLVFKEYPKYVKLQSKFRINVTIACCWTVGALSAVAETGMWDYAKTIDKVAANIPFHAACLFPSRRVRAFSLTFFLGLYFIPVMLVSGFSIAFLILLRGRLMKNKVGAASSSTHSAGTHSPAPDDEQPSASTTGNQGTTTKGKTQRNRYVKPALSLIALVSAMAVCVLPYGFYVVTIELFCPECNDVAIIFGLLLLQYCNAALDPFLYALTQRKIQKLYCSCLLGKPGAT